MRLSLTGCVLILACLTSGCAKYWYRDGASFEQCRKDLASCRAEATRYSDVERTYGLGSYEKNFVKGCMQEKGYQLLAEKNLPVRVKRESSPVFGIPGVAGTID